MRVGLALSPGTPASAAHALADAGLLDLVLVMTVTPGFGGQPFQESELAKVRELRQRYPALDLQVDGGLAPGRTVAAAAAAGANVVVAGSAIFGAPDAAAAISALREALLAWSAVRGSGGGGAYVHGMGSSSGTAPRTILLRFIRAAASESAQS